MIDKIIKGLVEGLGPQIKQWFDEWKRKQNPKKILDEMLRNPKWRFRKTETLAKAIDDSTENYQETRELLKAMGARHNLGEQDTWIMDKNWEEDKDGKWVLREGVISGKK